jgi:hypothetical protein
MTYPQPATVWNLDDARVIAAWEYYASHVAGSVVPVDMPIGFFGRALNREIFKPTDPATQPELPSLGW